MFKKLIFFIAVLFIQKGYSQLTLIVDEVPKKTPENAEMYISGDFEGWSGGKEEYKLSKKGETYSINIPSSKSSINFKFTLGTWDSVETDAKGASLGNRSYTFNKPKDTLHVQVAGWGHLLDLQEASTATENVTVLSEDFEIPQLKRNRRVWMYLPPGYGKTDESYPVVYMHDGQNLFDNKTSYSGEWSVDETLNKLFREKNLKLIVVGIDNGGSKRLDEYSPWVNEKYGGGEGDAYLEFVVNTLKPYIDNNYRTLKDKHNTGIIGSSMGGLISHYAGLKYPTIFGKVGVFSPAFWFAPEINTFSKNNGTIKDSQFYFLAGGKEGDNTAFSEINQTVKGMNSMVSILKNQGFTPKNIQTKVVPEGKHNEELWLTNFEESILWLFPNAIKKREFISAKLTDYQLQVKVSDGVYEMQFYAPKITETTFIPAGEITRHKESHAVVFTSAYSDVQISEDDSQIVFKTKDVSIKIEKNPFTISYWYKGKKITSEKNGYQRTDAFETLQFNLTPDEILYGGGARVLGMNRRGNRLQLYNKAHYGYETESELMNFTLPIAVSSKQYMIHFDNAPIGYLDFDSDKDNTLTYETISGRKTYQVIVGDSWLDMIDNYTNLTGKQPLPPRWAFGNFSSRFGYHSQKETEFTLNKFREEQIPVDAVILDLYWFGKDIQGTMGNLEVHKDSFPDFKGMVSRLNKKGVKTVLISEPFVLTTSKRWDEAVSNDILAKDSLGNPYTYDFYFGNTGLIDIYNPKGEQWFWNIYKGLADYGVSGVWGDLGEPEVHPTDLIHHTGTADEVHNIYGHDWARLVYEGYARDFPDQRPFILMRAGYSGSQRYGLMPWSGDVNRTWGGLQSQPEIALQMGMQGLAYMHSDLGGFAGANLDDELYTRWLQYGVFQPIYRPHAQEDVPSEPVFRSVKAKALAKQSIELRYKLLTYNYNLAFENHRKGTPLMRPLFFEENSVELSTDSSSYLWGKDFLVIPILQPDIQKKEVYFPKSNFWFDFYSDEKMEAGMTKEVSIKENSIPTYVRAGAFIPIAKLVQSTDDYVFNDFEMHYYFDQSVNSSKRTFYNDDGLTNGAYEKGAFEILNFEAAFKHNNLEFDIDAQTGNSYQASRKRFQLILHNWENKPKYVRVNGSRLNYLYNPQKRTLSISLDWDTAKALELKIKLNK